MPPKPASIAMDGKSENNWNLRDIFMMSTSCAGGKSRVF
jgi:hypothetical protein